MEGLAREKRDRQGKGKEGRKGKGIELVVKCSLTTHQEQS